jgi:hypothetical protein
MQGPPLPPGLFPSLEYVLLVIQESVVDFQTWHELYKGERLGLSTNQSNKSQILMEGWVKSFLGTTYFLFLPLLLKWNENKRKYIQYMKIIVSQYG